jgi:hypothetical protein
MINNKKKAVFSIFVLALLVVGAVWATSASISWTPERFTPWSIAPGETMTAKVSFTNKGPSTINSKKLGLRIDGNAARLVTVGAVTFPQSIKKGNVVDVPLAIAASSSEPTGVVHGELLLLELKPDGSVKEIFSDALSIEITVSTIPLPPDPGDAGKADLLGIDSDGNGVRDDIDRYIVFNHPDSARKREALTEVTKTVQSILTDAHNREVSVESHDMGDKILGQASLTT